MLKVSLVLLTHNRADSVIKSFGANLKSAGYPIGEIIHVDNGSTDLRAIDWINNQIGVDVQILHSSNLGVSKGYNRGMLLATGSHIAITGCDRIMPDNWLARMAHAAEVIPETGVISCYSVPSAAYMLDCFASRYLGPVFERSGILIREAHVAEARLHSRDFLLKAGLFREDFGLYGYEDVEWAERAARVARQNGLRNYVLDSMDHAQHLDDGDGGKDYQALKTDENERKWKRELSEKCWELGNPYYNPYWRNEPELVHTLKAIK